MGGLSGVGALVTDDGYLAQRALAIREGFVSDVCELCGGEDQVRYVLFENEPVEEPLGAFTCCHCLLDPPGDDD